jgi:Uma2 family endonuclease
MSTQPKPRLTPDEYLDFEEAADYKSEYCHGELFAMAGAGWNHDLVSHNIGRQLGNQLAGRPCFVNTSDMRVYSPQTDLFTYADVIVTCGEPRLFQKGRRTATLLNPTVIVEVLSPTTEAYDRGLKFEHCKSIESVREYLLVSSDRSSVTLYRRQPDDSWLLTVATALDATVDLESCGCRLLLRDLYDKVEFPVPVLRAVEPE